MVPQYLGDPDGVGEAFITINLGRREVCWELSVSNVGLPATAAHIHQAPAGIRGGFSGFLSHPARRGPPRGVRPIRIASCCGRSCCGPRTSM